MKKIFNSLIIITSLLFSLAKAGSANNFIGPLTEKETQAQKYLATSPLPFFFTPGMVQVSGKTAGERALAEEREYLRLLLSTEMQFEGTVNLPFISNGSLVVPTNIDSTSKVANGNKPVKMNIILEQYLRLPDGYIRVTFPGGSKIINEQELKVVVDTLVQAVNKAAEADYQYYKDIENKAIDGRAKQLGINHEQMLAVLVRDGRGLHGDIPADLKPSDFVPAELHFGCTPNTPIFGFCYLSSGFIGYNHNALQCDWMKGQPFILMHEMVHCNPKLEGFPLEMMDFELLASIPETLFMENCGDLMHHSYMAVLRELIDVHFNFDFKQARREMVRFDACNNLTVDEKKYAEYYDQLQRVKTDLLPTIRDIFIPEVYSDRYWWAAMHNRLGDNNGYLRIGMAIHYDLAGLGGRQKTMEWLEENRRDIQSAADRAWEKTDDENNDGDNQLFLISRKIGVPRFLLERYSGALDDQEKERLALFFKNNPDAFGNVKAIVSARNWRGLDRFIRYAIGITTKPDNLREVGNEK